MEACLLMVDGTTFSLYPASEKLPASTNVTNARNALNVYGRAVQIPDLATCHKAPSYGGRFITAGRPRHPTAKNHSPNGRLGVIPDWNLVNA
jgi:hypothetical protein